MGRRRIAGHARRFRAAEAGAVVSRGRALRAVLALCAALAFCAFPASALAGNFLATGHDADFHCQDGEDQCHYLLTAINFVRSGAPNPNLPVLVLDPGNEVSTAMDDITSTLGAASIPRVVMAPQSATFASASLNTSSYSAIIVASDSSCGGCDLNGTSTSSSQTPDSDAINARAGDIHSFFNSGGGLLYLAGADHGGGDPSLPQTYYSSVPLGFTGVAVQGPFRLTSAGQALGFQDATNGIGTHDDINCCATHNSFAPPAAGSPIQVAETDQAGNDETIFVTNGAIGSSGFSGGTTTKPSVSANPPAVQSSTSASFSGTVNPQGASTTAVFQYGLDPSYTGGGAVTYTNQVPASPSPVGSDFSNHTVSATATGLVPNAVYHVRLVASNSVGTTIGPDQTLTTRKAAAPGQPVLGKSFNAVPVSGRVFVKPPGSGSTTLSGPVGTGPGFVPLTQVRQLSAGTQIDTRFGTIKVINATGRKGRKAKKLQNATFTGAIFNVKQARAGANKGLVTVSLLEALFPGAPGYGSCKAKAAEAGPLAQVAVSGSVLSTLRSRSSGRYSSRGRYGSATSRGTGWTITDRCKSTLIAVQRDVVVVRDFVHHRTITLRAGQRILIKAKR